MSMVPVSDSFAMRMQQTSEQAALQTSSRPTMGIIPATLT